MRSPHAPSHSLHGYMQACALVHLIESRRSCIIFLVIFITSLKSLIESSMHGRAVQRWGGRRREERERRVRRTHWDPQAASGAYKDGPPPPLCLPVFPTYFPLLTAMLKDPLHLFYAQATVLIAICDGSSQSTAACSKARRELVLRLSLQEKPAFSSRIL